MGRKTTVCVLHQRCVVRAPIVIALLLMGLPSIVSAQETRAGAIAEEQARKAQALAPRDPPFAEKLVLAAHKGMVLQPAGLYPYFDSVYSGGGFTLGAGYRDYTGDKTHWNVAGLYSIAGFKLIDAGMASRVICQGSDCAPAWRRDARVAYHGLGIEPGRWCGFRMQQTCGGGDVTLRGRLLVPPAPVRHYDQRSPNSSP